jgi:DNA-binding SARP family transcriptional activator
LISNLHKLLGPALGGAAPVVHEEGYYRLNNEVGIAVDIDCFDALISQGDQYRRAGDHDDAAVYYRRALSLYRGELCVATDAYVIVERERLRKSNLSLLAYLAGYHYQITEYATCLEYAWKLLANDPCREDAHRLVMRCYVQFGQRVEALHQYHVCANILRTEFDIEPEDATTALFEQIRRDPSSI